MGNISQINGLQITAESASYAATASFVAGTVTSASYATQADNAAAIDIYSFSSPVDSYLLMSDVISTTGVAIGGDTDLRYNTSTNRLTAVNVSATTLTGSLLGTASYASQALSSSFASTVPASGVIGLNLSQIATASFSASLSPTQFTVTSASITEFTVTGTGVTLGSALTDTHRVTGSLNVTGSTTSTQIGVGAAPSGTTRLDVRAQGALSSDIAFRVRNSANTGNFLDVQGDGRYRLGDANGGLSNSFSYISDGRLFMAKAGGNFIELNNSAQNRIYNPAGGWEITGNTTIATVAAGSNTGTGNFQFYAGNLQIGTGLVASSAASMSIWMSNGTAPSTNASGRHWYYSANRNGVAGKASPHFRTEDGTVVWLGDESRLFNVTASRTTLSASNATSNGPTLTVFGSGSVQPVFTVQGSQGELFSVTDSLSGSLFSVNDISGLPILEVFSDNTTLIGNYLDPMLITTAKVTQTNSGSFVVYSLPTASYDTAFFEYSIKSGSNARAGTIMAIQSGTSVNFTETTTTDFGNTSAVSFTVVVTGSNMALTGSSTSGAWTIKTIVRSI